MGYILGRWLSNRQWKPELYYISVKREGPTNFKRYFSSGINKVLIQMKWSGQSKRSQRQFQGLILGKLRDDKVISINWKIRKRNLFMDECDKFDFWSCWVWGTNGISWWAPLTESWKLHSSERWVLEIWIWKSSSKRHSWEFGLGCPEKRGT